MRKSQNNMKKNLMFSVFVVLFISFYQVITNALPTERVAKFYYFQGDEDVAYGIEVFYLEKDSVELTLSFYGKKIEKSLNISLSGKKTKNPAYRVLTDECSHTDYPVNCYIVDNDSCSFEFYISIWNDRFFLKDKNNYFKRKYPQYNFDFGKTYRRNVLYPY
jgi:hypothetical protein